MNKLRSKSCGCFVTLTDCRDTCICVRLPFFWVLLATHPLLPQLLFQRCQAAFLPQHAAIPPAREIHIKQLCVTALGAGGLGMNCQAEIKRGEVGSGELFKDRVKHKKRKNIWVCTVHRGGKDVLKPSCDGVLINNLCCAIKR